MTKLKPSWASIVAKATNSDSALLDSGANVSLVAPNIKVAQATKQQASKNIIVPNGATMTTSETAVFQWKKIGEPARICHKVKGLVHNLATVANLVDEGHEVTFREHYAIVTNKQNDIVLRGWRDLSNRL